MKNLNFTGWIKPNALGDSSIYQGAEDSEDIVENMNEQMDIKVKKFDTGDKLANLIFAIDESAEYTLGDGTLILAFEFKDGSTKNAVPYFNAVINHIDSMISEMEGDDSY
jgi:hypothetical protein